MDAPSSSTSVRTKPVCCVSVTLRMVPGSKPNWYSTIWPAAFVRGTWLAAWMPPPVVVNVQPWSGPSPASLASPSPLRSRNFWMTSPPSAATTPVSTLMNVTVQTGVPSVTTLTSGMIELTSVSSTETRPTPHVFPDTKIVTAFPEPLASGLTVQVGTWNPAGTVSVNVTNPGATERRTHSGAPPSVTS